MTENSETADSSNDSGVNLVENTKVSADAVTCDYRAEPSAEQLASILDEYSGRLKAEPMMLGDFRILRDVGRGGMGVVFEAEQVSLKRRVALKVLQFGAVSDHEAIERFKREAETVANLHHTNIVPIFAVGSEKGLNYYVMQFIEGGSLADVLAKSQESISPQLVAGWGLQAAEALEHAHQRGVIHRDVKPSNLLLDRGNRLWLSDFGLARRIDDLTLSLTGALLGTPRYMSPEQAAAISGDRIDHRTDLFSLGATLYELLTGQPAFGGETPRDVIQHIIKTEPTPIRQVSKSVPRDLETVVTKCLAKEPSERYASASDVADDLRAFLDGRPIRARRAGPVERAKRWLRKHRRTALLTTVAVAVTLLLVASGGVGWLRYDSWRQAAIRLDAANPPLIAEILTAQDEVLSTVTAPMQESSQFPAGDYQVRVSGASTLSQTFDLHLERGKESNYTLNLHDQMLWPSTTLERGYSIVDFGDEQALVLWTDGGVGIRKRKPPYLAWNMKLTSPLPTALANMPGLRWPWTSPSISHSGYGTHDYRPWLAPTATDINGDGIGDLTLAARHQAWLMAISGNDGHIIWFAGRGEELRSPLPEDWMRQRTDMRSAVLGDPIVTHDCDRDGVNDIIATMVDLGSVPAIQQDRFAARRWVEAISGKTGQTLWSYDLPAKLFEIADGATVPYDLRWFPSADGYSSGGRSSLYAFRHITRQLRRSQRIGAHVYQPAPAELVSIESQSRVALTAGTHAVVIDPANGEEVAAPLDIGARPGKAPRWSDVDGDGSADLVLLEEIVQTTVTNTPKARLVVWSYARKDILWSAELETRWPERVSWTVDTPQWPLVTDVDGDGRSEVVVPTNGPTPPGQMPAETPWGRITVFAGDSGQRLWERRIPSADQQIDHFVVGPDLDQDGHRELYAASLSGNDLRVWVDALSGADGHTLWTSCHMPRNHGGNNAGYVLAPPRWWRAGHDGRPHLVVHAVDEVAGGDSSSLVSLFSAADGKVSHFGYDIASVTPADIDRDGVEDLLLHRTRSPMRRDMGGSLHCVRGLAAEPWQRLGEVGDPIADLDGDGVRDMVQTWADGTLLATSGLSGMELWRTRALVSDEGVGFRTASNGFRSRVSQSQSFNGDLDGDGTADLLVWKLSGNGRKETPFHAVSGRTGRLLWSVTGVSARVIADTLAAEARDLNGDGQAEVLWLAALDHQYPDRAPLSANYVQLWLFVTSGQTGRLKWSRALSPAYGLVSQPPAPFHFPNIDVLLSTADLDGDQVEDVLVPSVAEDNGVKLLVLSGKEGKQLWSRAHASEGPSRQLLENWVSPTTCDLNGDGQLEVIVLEPAPLGEGESEFSDREIQILSLPANGGPAHWTYRSGVRFDRWMTPSAERPDVLQPVVLQAAGGQARVGFYLPADHGKLVTIDASGRAHERAMARPTHPVPLAGCDVDGDGVDEVVFVERSTIQTAPVDRLDQPLWTQTLSTGIEPQLLEILPATNDRAPLIAVALDATDNSVLGLDAASGTIVWSCPGPISRDPSDGDFKVPRRIAVISGADRPVPLPLVYYAYGSVASVRQASAVGPSSTEAERDMKRMPFRTSPFVPPVTSTSRSDERWQRDLPWRVRELQVGEVRRLVGGSFFYAITLVIAPGAYLMRVLPHRRLSLRMLMLLPVIAACCILALLLPAQENDFSNSAGRFVAAVGFTPAILFTACILWWLAHGRWKPIVVWLSVSGVLAAVCGAASILLAIRYAPLLPEERYDLAGWYTIWFLAAYLTSWIVMLQLLATNLVIPRVKKGWSIRRGRGGTAVT